MEVTFEVGSLENAEAFDPLYATDAQALCAKMTAKTKGGVGPFGLLVLASADQEEATAVFFRIFKAQDKHVVLMCHDPTRFVSFMPIIFPSIMCPQKRFILNSSMCLHIPWHKLMKLNHMIVVSDLWLSNTEFIHSFIHSFCMSRSSKREMIYKPTFAGFVDVDIEKTNKISLRSLVCWNLGIAFFFLFFIGLFISLCSVKD